VIHEDAGGELLLTRRRIVQLGGAAAAGLVLGGAGSARAASAGSTTGPAYLRRSSYSQLKNTAFTATAAGGATVTLRLAEVADLARARSEKSLAGSDAAFALTLTGPRKTPLAGSLHELRHASLGTFSLFLVPVGRPTSTDQRYEVVVDRSMTQASAGALAPH
jgi:hypothetical protein